VAATRAILACFTGKDSKIYQKCGAMLIAETLFAIRCALGVKPKKRAKNGKRSE
jgi:hypothetical protein